MDMTYLAFLAPKSLENVSGKRDKLFPSMLCKQVYGACPLIGPKLDH